MTLIELATLVKDARDKQRLYFKTRTQTALEASKLSERAVSQILDPPTLNFGDDR